MRYVHRWMVGSWTFYQVEDHGFGPPLKDKPLFGFTVMPEKWREDGTVKMGELYNSLEHAMAAAIAEKYTGKRGAGGTGVDTAAGWFMRMIGADQLQPDPEAMSVVGEALRQVKGLTRVPTALTAGLLRNMEKTGHVVARPAGRD